MTASERYPNVPVRLLGPYNLEKEKKTIVCLGHLHTGTEYGDLQEICTVDVYGVYEFHLINATFLKSNDNSRTT